MVVDAELGDPTLVEAADVAASLGADPAAGLSAAEAADRQTRFGPNRIDPGRPSQPGGSSSGSSPIRSCTC